jgi:hypothetical protein
MVLFAGLAGSLATLAAGVVPANAAPETVTAGPVRAISSVFDPVGVGSQHVFSATASGVWETYWNNGSTGAKLTHKINNLAGVTALTSFYDPANGGSLHVFSATPSGVYETHWSSTSGATRKINTLAGVNALTSFYDPANGGSLHVFAATPSGVAETYWFNTNPNPNPTGLINTLAGC